MNVRDMQFPPWQVTMRKLAEGTALGLIGRYATWSLEKMTFDAATLPGFNYREQLRKNFNPKAFKELHHIFKDAGAWQTGGKALSSMGVAMVVDHQCSHFSPLQKGLATAVGGFWLEAATTASGEAKRVKLYRQMQKPGTPVQNIGYFTPAFARAFQVTAVRALWTSLTTFPAIHLMDAAIRPLVPKKHQDSVWIKAGAALTASFVIQPANMPVINWQTYVLLNPDRRGWELSKEFYRCNNFLDFFKGSLWRSIHRGTYYGITFFGAECIKKLERRRQAAEGNEGPSVKSPCPK